MIQQLSNYEQEALSKKLEECPWTGGGWLVDGHFSYVWYLDGASHTQKEQTDGMEVFLPYIKQVCKYGGLFMDKYAVFPYDESFMVLVFAEEYQRGKGFQYITEELQWYKVVEYLKDKVKVSEEEVAKINRFLRTMSPIYRHSKDEPV